MRSVMAKTFREVSRHYCASSSTIVRRFNILDAGLCRLLRYRVHRKGFATDLASFKSPEHVEFLEPFKSMIRNGLCAGVEYSVSTEPTQFEKFKRFYLALSKHEDSIGPDNLDGPYFNKYMESLDGNLVVVEATYKRITIGMSLSFIDENEVCCHLV